MLEVGQETYDGFMFFSIFWLCLCTCAGTVKTPRIRQGNFSKYIHCTLSQCAERDSEHFLTHNEINYMNVGKKVCYYAI